MFEAGIGHRPALSLVALDFEETDHLHDAMEHELNDLRGLENSMTLAGRRFLY